MAEQNFDTHLSRAWSYLEQNQAHDAVAFCRKSLTQFSDPQLKDQLCWPLGYALVEQGEFDEARAIWSEIFERTQDHKALHQVGMVERELGNYIKALRIFHDEFRLIPNEDHLSRAVNLYELCFCSWLNGDIETANKYLVDYEALNLPEDDLVERGCFFRLKGDLLKGKDIELSRNCYLRSKEYFDRANDSRGSREISQRLSSL